MNGSRNELFSRASLSQNQHRRFRRRDNLRLLQHRAESSARADYVAKFMSGKVLSLLRRPLIRGDPLLDRTQQVLIIERLG